MNEFLTTVGPFLIPLVALSVYSFGLILVKASQFRLAKPLSSERILALLDSQSKPEEGVTGLDPRHPVTVVWDHRGDPLPLLQARAQNRLAELEDRLSYFPALANISTLCGLFGTVVGMILSFLALRSGGGADPSSLAGGLGQALVATAMGLVTAIPSLIAHAFFQKRMASLTTQLEILLSALLPGAEAVRD